MPGVNPSDFPFVMISAMYENGGNTTQRLLDGHPELLVYPFESQPGTRYVLDHLTSMFPQKYRWPEFALSATPAQDYHAIIDEEGKVRARTPHVSKFRDHPMDFNDDDRRDIFLRLVKDVPRSRAANVAAFFTASFEAWRDLQRSGRERVQVGYSPIIGVDAEKICGDLPLGHVLHVVRNPWSAVADTLKRPVPLSLQHYVTGWVVTQYAVLVAREAYPDRVHIVRYEDIVEDPTRALAGFCQAVGIDGSSPTLREPSWNGRRLEQVYPWGTIRVPTPEVNRQTAAELSPEQADEVRRRAGVLLDAFGYRDLEPHRG